jgi:UDP-glucose 4-epimerase
MSDALLWIVGSGGFLGSHLRRALVQHLPTARFWNSTPLHFSWTNPKRLAEELPGAVATFAAAVRKQRASWALLWCAGTGVVTSSAAELEPEWAAWIQLLDLVGRHLAEPHSDIPGSIFFSSSAGGVYGGSVGQPLTEHTPPQPVSDYGKHKLRMEGALQNWATMFPNISCLIGRISSLYGQGQNLQKAQGIISHLSRCLIYRYPANIYVPLDTRRDYLLVDDCAHHLVASLLRLMTERPSVLIKIFAAEELTSLARIVGIFFRMVKHRPLIISQQRRAATQPESLKLHSDVWPNLQRRTDLGTGIHLLHEHQLNLFRQGLLPPPQRSQRSRSS